MMNATVSSGAARPGRLAPSRWTSGRLAWPLAAALIAVGSLAAWIALAAMAIRLFR